MQDRTVAGLHRLTGCKQAIVLQRDDVELLRQRVTSRPGQIHRSGRRRFDFDAQRIPAGTCIAIEDRAAPVVLLFGRLSEAVAVNTRRRIISDDVEDSLVRD